MHVDPKVLEGIGKSNFSFIVSPLDGNYLNVSQLNLRFLPKRVPSVMAVVEFHSKAGEVNRFLHPNEHLQFFLYIL